MERAGMETAMLIQLSVRDYIRSTMLRVFKVLNIRYTESYAQFFHREPRDVTRAIMKVAWEISNYIFEAKVRDPWWDYAWWDYSYWAEEEIIYNNI